MRNSWFIFTSIAAGVLLVGILLISIYRPSAKSIFKKPLHTMLGMHVAHPSQQFYKMIEHPDSFDYNQLWRELQNLQHNGMVKDAEKLVTKIYNRAKSDNEPYQLTKAIVHRAEIMMSTKDEPESYNSVMQLYRSEIAANNAPVSNILHSLLADGYNQYANRHRYKLSKVTPTDEAPDTNDITTWSLQNLTEASFNHYRMSVKNAEELKIPIGDLTPIISQDQEDENLRPTIYDVLAHRALDFFVNDVNYLTKPQDHFELNQSVIFDDVNAFVNAKFTEKEAFAGHYDALLLLQDILKYHQKDKDPAALINANLKRLKFAKEHGVMADKNELYLNALTQLQKKYADNEASAEIAAYIGDEFYEIGQKYNPKKGDDYKWDWKRAFDIYEKAIRDFPDSYGGKLCQNKQARLMQKNLKIETERINLPNENILAKVDFRNVEHVYAKIIKIDHKALEGLWGINAYKRIDTLNTMTALKSWELDLPDDGDLHAHSTEIKIDALPVGEYFVLLSDNEYFSYEYQAVNLTFLRVSNIAYFSKARKDGKKQFYVVDRTTGQPMKDVKVEAYTRNYNSRTRKYERKRAGNFTTDGNGTFDGKFSSYYYLNFSKGDDLLDMDEQLYNYDYNEKEQTTHHTQFFTDRAIYRPGQTVYFKGLAYDKDAKGNPTIATNQKITVTFKDVNHQPIEKKTFTTNEYGTFHGEFKAPQGGLLGQMYLESDYSKNSWYSQRSIRVEEYKRPKFEVSFNPVTGSYKLNETVKVTGKAQAYAGNNIDGAKVQYRVVRNVVYPYWRWWWGTPPYMNDQEIKHGETVTNENGEFEIDFTALPDNSADAQQTPQFNFEVSVDVVDITGETHSQTQYVSVGYVALKADINLPKQVNKAAVQPFGITTQNLNGAFEAAKGNIAIYPLQAPDRIFKEPYWSRPDKPTMTKEQFYENFSSYPFADENEYTKWAKGKAIYDENFDTEKSKTITLSDQTINQLSPGQYQIVLETKDKFGKEIEVVKYFEVFDLKDTKVPAMSNNWFYAENKAYAPNETANIYFGAAYSREFVLYEVYDGDSKLIESKWVGINNIRNFQIPIKEEYRGNIGVSVSFVMDNRSYTNYNKILVPWSNKDLKIEYSTFRNKLLPGQKEEWIIKISGDKKDAVAAEAVAAMYDASLDAFAVNSWSGSYYPYFSPSNDFNTHNNFTTGSSSLFAKEWQPRFPSRSRAYPSLTLNAPLVQRYYAMRSRAAGSARMKSMSVESAPPTDYGVTSSPSVSNEEVALDGMRVRDDSAFEVAEDDGVADSTTSSDFAGEPDAETAQDNKDFSNVKVRTNLNETVFFQPDLMTDAEGNVVIKFTMNEALTRWKFLLFAHTKELEYGFSTNEVVTQKDLMVMPNAPRFFRENDQIVFNAKVSNLSDGDLTGTAQLLLFDALTMKAIDTELGNTNPTITFDAKKGQSDLLTWKISIPDEGISAVTYRVVAKAGNFSDGEESAVPVLTNRMLLTETMPMSVRGGQSKDFTFKAMQKAKSSKTLKNHKATLEFTANPAWYAVQSLPYLMEYPYECTEQVFSRFYANSLAAAVTSSHPKIKKVFEEWKNTDTDALVSNLAKNEELKYALLEETPWVLASQNEAIQKKNIGLLFDLNKMEDELGKAVKKLEDRQLSNGGFAWFPGGRDSWYITQYLVEGMGHLKHLGVNQKLSGIQSVSKMDDVLAKAVIYVDERMIERYDRLAERVKEGKAKWENDNLSNLDVHYLYARSFYKDIKLSKKAAKVHDYFISQVEKYWQPRDIYNQGMMALVLHRNDKATTAATIVESLRQRSLSSDELGMYWKYNSGYYWYQLPIETHCMMIEVFDEVAKDEDAVADLKLWLLKNKQTTHWKTTKATAAAVYVLLSIGDDWLASDEDIEIKIGGETLDQSDIKKEAGTGYFKVEWTANDFPKNMENISIKNPNKAPAWGALYWQYFEDLDQVDIFNDTPLKIKKTLYKEVNTSSGKRLESINEKSPIESGDKVMVKIELRVDRDMEYVHMKDMRASGFEPINVLSQYKYQGGLGYYESTRDAATNFFFTYLPKGTYIFEYPLRAVHKGDFSNGVTTVQCMYAPEFTAHSTGIRVEVK